MSHHSSARPPRHKGGRRGVHHPYMLRSAKRAGAPMHPAAMRKAGHAPAAADAADAGREIIEALGRFELDRQVIASLTEIARRFGEVGAVSALQPDKSGRRLYLVWYKESGAALAASLALGCTLYGYTSIMVWVPRFAGKARPQAGH